jgi:transcriptional regulator GlxA family with amidase domain
MGLRNLAPPFPKASELREKKGNKMDLAPTLTKKNDSHETPSGTTDLHRIAAERVVREMRQRLGDSLTLDEMAEIAMMSPYHFNRVFRRLTGIPPSQFLGALRLEAAKRLLLTSERSVTEICFEVGYNSLGTFTTRFNQLVGLRQLSYASSLRSSPQPAQKIY